MRLTYALIFHKKDVPILPCYRSSKAILEGYGPHRDKAPDIDFLYSWIKDQGNNFALVTGYPRSGPGLVVLDFDDQEVFNCWAREAGSLADTFTVATYRGYHVYYWAEDHRSWKANGVDILGSGRAVIGPFCDHPKGGIYQPLNQPVIRTIDTVSDFPLLSDNRPDLPQPPEKPPERLTGKGQGRGAVARIKASWPIEEALQLLQPRSFQSLKGSGRWARGLCPFHDDKRPSFWIDRERNLFGCHTCEAGGDVINLVALTYGLDSRAAIKAILAADSLVIQGVEA